MHNVNCSENSRPLSNTSLENQTHDRYLPNSIYQKNSTLSSPWRSGPPSPISPQNLHQLLSKIPLKMPIFTASLGSVSRTNIAFHSHLFACDITSQNHHHYHHQQQHFSSSITSVNGSRTNPPSVLRFPFFSGCCSAKRAAFFAPKVSVSSDSAAKAVGVDQEQSLSPEDVRQDRVCSFVVFVAFFWELLISRFWILRL